MYDAQMRSSTGGTYALGARRQKLGRCSSCSQTRAHQNPWLRTVEKGFIQVSRCLFAELRYIGRKWGSLRYGRYIFGRTTSQIHLAFRCLQKSGKHGTISYT